MSFSICILRFVETVLFFFSDLVSWFCYGLFKYLTLTDQFKYFTLTDETIVWNMTKIMTWASTLRFFFFFWFVFWLWRYGFLLIFGSLLNSQFFLVL